MVKQFSPSVNIIRDEKKPLHYIPTTNARRIYDQILSEYKSGTHSFNIIGSYGTGKSAFLMAFQKTLKGEAEFFAPVNGQFKGWKDFEFLNLVGEYKSLMATLGTDLADDPNLKGNQLIKLLDAKAYALEKKKKNFVFIVDEFGKFLEYAAKHNPDQELYFIQQVAELANDPERNILFITTLHQGFDAYGAGLDQAQRKEWEKVKGRIKELTFNEPVEQLLYLASERLSLREKQAPKQQDKLYDQIVQSRVFPLRSELSPKLAQDIYPLDLASAGVLALALQRYGQNERSLFSFLETNDYLGLEYFEASDSPYYHLGAVYDYLLHNYFSFLTSKFNPDFIKWSAIRKGIERVESYFPERVAEATFLVKSIGLLNVFASAGARIDGSFLDKYAQWAGGYKEIKGLLESLENKKIIRFLHHKGQFILFEGTDLDIDRALQEASEKFSPITDLVRALKEHFDFPPISARRITYQLGTPRFFKFILSDAPISEAPTGEVDGYINLIFSEEWDESEVRDWSLNHQEKAILFGNYQATGDLRDILWEMEKIKHILKENQDDWVARRELNSLLAYMKEVLNEKIRDHIFSEEGEIAWYYGGRKRPIKGTRKFNDYLSWICEQCYPLTPTYRNELINRNKLPSAISKARRNLVQRVIENSKEENLGFPKESFPPEKTIYLSLLKQTGIHRFEEGEWQFLPPTEESFLPLWEASMTFLDSAKKSRRNLLDLFETLSSGQLKLKDGFLHCWIPFFLLIQSESFAIYHQERLLLSISSETIDLIIKNPADFMIKTYEVSGIRGDLLAKFREFLQLGPISGTTSGAFIETVKPFLTFYKSLPEFARITQKWISPSAQALRLAIEKATDPEMVLFKEFPEALGFSQLSEYSDTTLPSDQVLESFIQQLQDAVRELRSCFQDVREQALRALYQSLALSPEDFSQVLLSLEQRYGPIQEMILPEHLRKFRQRLLVTHLEEDAFISNLAGGVVGKRMEALRDEEIDLLLHRIPKWVAALDEYCHWDQTEQETYSEAFRLSVQKQGEDSKKLTLRVPKGEEENLSDLEKKIRKALTGNEKIALIALARILNEKLADGES